MLAPRDFESEDGMNFRFGAVSLLTLGLMAGAALAQEAAQEGEPAPGETAVEQAPPAEPAPEPAAETAPEPAPAGEVGQPASADPIPEEVLALLNDNRAVADMDAAELRNRARSARNFAKQQGLPDDVRAKLQDIAQAARAELDARASQPKKAEEPAAAEQPPAPAEQPVVQPVEQAAPVEQPPAPAEQPLEQAAPVEQPVEQPVDQPATNAAETPAAPAQPPAVDKKEVQELDANAGEPEAEKKAKQFLATATPADQMSDYELKKRLDDMRDLMAANELSQKTERALRKQLQTDRRVLRQRVAAKQAAEEQAKAKADAEAAAAAAKKAQQQGTAPKVDKKPRIVIVPQITIETPIAEVLRDRRRSEELSDSELRRRAQVFRDAQARNDWEDFDEEDQLFWRESVRRDRELLRRRMAEERRLRVEELAMNAEEDDLDVEDDFQPGRKSPRNVFEAEADDEELEEVLIAPPKKKVRQRYTIEEIADREELRDAMPRIEIDTIRFGFNEAFVREEEVENLDRIAAIIERVLRKRPREIFLIEGHTDAVGSDAYNLKLSRARAEAVKKALITYYVISPRNLQTVGLGERYLKIPTAEPEGENRRVSISRATPLVGELED